MTLPNQLRHRVAWNAWKWFLPLLQPLLAFSASIYGSHEYRSISRSRGVFGDNNVLEYSAQNFPAPVERVSRGIDFPALVLAYPLKEHTEALIDYNTDYTLVWISLYDLAFFAGIVIFWFWAGKRVDEIWRQVPRTNIVAAMRNAFLAFQFVFATLTGLYASHLALGTWYPERQIGTFGMAWTLVLLANFASRALRKPLPVVSPG